MGSTSSKFRKALQTGDEKTAEEIYHSSQEFQKSLDPNMSYGENYQHNTPLHYASRHGMHRLIRCSLQKHHGNPNKRNTLDQTSLHCVCMEEVHRPPSSTSSYSQYYYSQPPEKKRAECLCLIVGWKGIKMGSGEHEQVDVNAVDEDGNSALHYAAASGYRSLVEMLLENGASLFQENVDKETPCDCAEKNHNYDIAQLLESKMVFSQNSEEEPVGDISAIQYEEAFSGMRPQELREAKDVLVVETADMLRVPLFTAEALLRNHEWSREALLEGWMSDPAECCENSGVKPPENLGSFVAEHQLTTMDAATPETEKPEATMEQDEDEDGVMCDICTCSIEISVDTPCSHQFCKECWQRYLSGKIVEGNAHNIVCPAYPCDKLVPAEIIENVVDREMSRRYLQFDIKAFVESHPNIKWCPVAGCGRAVKLPDVDTPQRETPSPTSPPPMSHAVDCGEGHIFCWNCSRDPHEPCSCENWKKWQEKVAEVKPEDLTSLDVETESASNYLWLVTNSKPCPKCSSPIQKNEGCNHMKCTKCKHDFCWVCLEPWSKHSSETGGYFRCNRFEVVQKVEEKAESLLTEADKKNKEMQELNRFLHYYSRFKNHGHSHKLEEPLMKKAPSKMKKLACHTAQTNEGPVDTKFIEEAITELLKARRTLKFSYPYGYYLEDRGGSKQIFEFMQNELEDSTESLSQMVARHYLRTPRSKIIQTAQLVVRKRHEFLCAVSKGFLPPETPPSSRRQTISRSWPDSDSDEEDEALRRAIEVSLQEAMAQKQQQQQQENSDAGEDESYLPPELRTSKSLHGRERRRHDSGNRDSSSMTAGLLRALEMSQLLLMQQTERLGQPGSSSSQDDSTGNHDNQTTTEHAGSSTGDASLASLSSDVAARPLTSSTSRNRDSVGKTKHGRHSLDAGLSSGSGDIRGNRSSTYEEDLRRAVELSLQEAAKQAGSLSSVQPSDQPSSSGVSARGSSQLDFDQILNDICRQDDRNSRGDGGRRVTGERKHKHGSPAGKGKKGKTKRKDDKQMNPWELNQPPSSMNLSTEMETEFDRIKREISSKEERQLRAGGAGASGSNGNGAGKSGEGLKKPRSISDVGKPSLLISGPQSSSWSPSRSLATGKKNSSGKNYPSVRLQRVPSPNLNSQGRPQGNRSTNDPFSVLLDSSSNHLQVQPATVLSASAEDMHQPRLRPGRSLQRSASDRATTSSSKSLMAGLLPPRKSSLTGGDRREISFSFVMTSKRTSPSPKPAKSHASTESPWEFQPEVAKKMAAEAAAQNSDQYTGEGSGFLSHRRSSLEKASDSLISVPKFSTLPVHSKRSKSESPAKEGGRKSKSKSRHQSSGGVKSAASAAAAELQILQALSLSGNPDFYDPEASKGHIHPRKLEKTAPLAQPESSSDNHHSTGELRLASSLSVSKAKSPEEQRQSSSGSGESSGLITGAEGGLAVEELLRIDQEEEDKESGVWQMYL